jgi:hypothetical protein
VKPEPGDEPLPYPLLFPGAVPTTPLRFVVLSATMMASAPAATSALLDLWEFMEPIEIPVATLPVKLVMGPACLLVVVAVLWWGVPKFRVFLRILLGREPRKPGTKRIHLALGFAVYALVFSPALITAAIFSDAGVAGGGGALSSRKIIAWDEIQRIDCDLRRAGRTVTLLRIVAPGKRIELSGGSDLTRVRDYIWASTLFDRAPFPSRRSK